MFAADSSVMLLAVSGRTFNQAIIAPLEVPGTRIATTQATTPDLEIGIFFAVCGFLVLLLESIA